MYFLNLIFREYIRKGVMLIIYDFIFQKYKSCKIYFSPLKIEVVDIAIFMNMLFNESRP